MAIGTSDGYIYFYDIHNLYERAIHVIDNKEYLRSIHILRSGSAILCISCSINNHVDCWDVNQMKLIHRTGGKLVWYDKFHLVKQLFWLFLNIKYLIVQVTVIFVRVYAIIYLSKGQ